MGAWLKGEIAKVLDDVDIKCEKCFGMEGAVMGQAGAGGRGRDRRRALAVRRLPAASHPVWHPT